MIVDNGEFQFKLERFLEHQYQITSHHSIRMIGYRWNNDGYVAKFSNGVRWAEMPFQARDSIDKKARELIMRMRTITTADGWSVPFSL